MRLLKPRPFVQSSFDMQVPRSHTCFLFFVFLRCRFFRVFFVPFPLSLCMESASYVLSSRMIFLYLVTAGWIFGIRLFSINQSRLRKPNKSMSLFPATVIALDVIQLLKSMHNMDGFGYRPETFKLGGSTIREGGDTTISSPGRSSKQPLPGMRLHDPLHGRQACRFCLRGGEWNLEQFNLNTIGRQQKEVTVKPPPYQI